VTSTPLTQSEVHTVIIGAMLALFLGALDQTVVSTALPAIARDFVVSTALPAIARDFGDFALISWVVTAYLLTSTCVTPIFGKLSDLYGRRLALRGCLSVFMLGSVLCAVSTDMVLLILARGLQGVGGGAIMTLTLTIIGDVVSPRERGRYQGYFSIVWAGSAILGPMLGGVMTERLGWPSIFWINLPLGLLAWLVCDRVLKKLPIEPRHGRIEYASALLLATATVALLLVLSLGGKRLPWAAPETFALTVAALLLFLLFARRQSRSAEPILPPRFVADGVIRPILIASFIIYGSYLALAVLVPVYFQVGLGLAPSDAGLLMIPMLLSSAITANLAGRWSRRSGRYKRAPLLALPLTVVALAMFAFIADRLAPAAAAVLFAIVGLGLGPFFPTSSVAAQNAVERRDLGAVSGAVGFVRALGGAVAIAGASALLLGLAAASLPQTDRAASVEELARQTLPAAARSAVAHAFGVTFGALAAVLSCGLLVFTLVEDRVLGDRPASTPAGE
jgi:EmrB/QacA subfamily drug resistance transporter